MSCDLIGELHDLMKLATSELSSATPPVKTTDGKKLYVHGAAKPQFENLDWQALGFTVPPENLIWWSITHHHAPSDSWEHDLSVPCPNPRITPEDRVCIFLLLLSDHLAATTGRVLRTGGTLRNDRVHRLWNPNFANSLSGKPEPIDNATALADVLKLIQANDAEKLLTTFRASMEIKPEDETIPRNVTSLLSHSLLVGQFYRILRENVVIEREPLGLKLAGKLVTTTQEAEREWQLHSLRAIIKFHQNPVRPADLNVFSRLTRVSEQFKQQFGDKLLFQTSDSAWIVLPYDDGDETPEGLNKKLRQAFEFVLAENFYLEIEIKTAPLKELGVWLPQTARQGLVRRLRLGLQRELTQAQQKISAKQQQIKALDEKRLELRRQMTRASNRAELGKRIQEADRALSSAQRELQELHQAVAGLEANLAQPVDWLDTAQYNHLALYPDDILHNRSFPPPLCEICQMRPAREREFANVIDYVCDVCDGIRAGGFRQKSIDDWDMACWIKVNLQAQALETTLVYLFADYVEASTTDAKQRAECLRDIRIAAIARDFVEDYRAFLADWDTKLRELVKDRNQELRDLETTDLRVVRIQDGAQLFQILNAFRVLCKIRFPIFFESNALLPPIRLGISIAAPKYPFYQHWRYISAPPAPVSVRIVGKRPLEVSFVGLDHLLQLDSSSRDREMRRGRSYLHKLAQIERRSASTALATVTLLSDQHNRRKPLPHVIQVFAKLVENQVLRMRDLLAYEYLTTFGVE